MEVIQMSNYTKTNVGNESRTVLILFLLVQVTG